MLIYCFIIISLLILMIVCQYAYEEGTDITSASFYVGVLELCFFMGCRSYLVGADTKEYYAGFQQITLTKFNNLNDAVLYGFNGDYVLNLEYGYKLLNKFVSFISHNSQTIILFIGVLSVVLAALLIKKYSPNPLLSLWLYVTLGLFQTQMNISRNLLAILISYFGIEYIHRKQFIKYLIIILLGAAIHSSVLLMLPVYFFVNYVKIDGKKMNLYFIMSLVLGLIIGVGKNIVLHFIPSKYAYLANNTDVKLDGLLVGIMYVILFTLIYLTTYSARNKLLKDNQFGTWMFLLTVLFYVSGIGLSFATRVAIIFGTFMMIYFPRLIYTKSISLNRRRILVTTIVIICGIEYILRLSFNNIGGTIPYTFFWNV